MLILFGGLANSHRLMACQDHEQILSPTLNSFWFNRLQINFKATQEKNPANAWNRTTNANESESRTIHAWRVRSVMSIGWWNENPMAWPNWSDRIHFVFHLLTDSISVEFRQKFRYSLMSFTLHWYTNVYMVNAKHINWTECQRAQCTQTSSMTVSRKRCSLNQWPMGSYALRSIANVFNTTCCVCVWEPFNQESCSLEHELCFTASIDAIDWHCLFLSKSIFSSFFAISSIAPCEVKDESWASLAHILGIDWIKHRIWLHRLFTRRPRFIRIDASTRA